MTPDMGMQVVPFFDAATSTFSYVVLDTATQHCAVIDSVMDYDPYSGTARTHSADQIIDYIQTHNLVNDWIIETHIHADHVSAAYYLKEKIGGKTGIGAHIVDVLKFWVGIFENQSDTPLTGEQFDCLFADGDTFTIGTVGVRVLHTPGHTPACLTYVVNDTNLFVGDTIFAPYAGTARCDFPGGNAAQLYASIQRLYTFSDATRIYLCHDYPEAGVDPMYRTTVGEQKKNNRMIHAGVSEAEFVEFRETRDYGKAVPKLIIPAIQTNARLGSFGDPSPGGIQFIKVPINQLNRDQGVFRKVTSKYFVTGQLTPAVIDDASARGFRSIVCFRPDHESPDQPLAADLAAYATQKGLTFIQLPVASMAAIPDATVAGFAKHYAELPTPIVGFCKSGGRALTVWKQMKETQ